jgi:hypothetical protein
VDKLNEHGAWSAGRTSREIMLIVFLFECGTKVIAHGFVLGPQAYLRDTWNR